MRRVLILLVSLAACSLWAVDPSRHISQYGHSAWRLQDGDLPGQPSAITQTTDGYIWVGTQSGLLRFDGVRFVPWEPPSGRQLPNSSALIVSLLGARDGSLWIGTNIGLAHWRNAELTNYPGAIAYIDSILEDRNGAIWVTRTRIRDWSGPLCQVVSSELRCYGAADGIPIPAAGPIAEDGQGYLWIGGTGALIRWKEGVARVYPLKGTTNDNRRMINGVVIRQDNTLVVGVDNVGPALGLQQFVRDRWKPLVKPGLNGSTLAVTTMFLDRDQSLWVGTMNQGIYRIHGEVVDHFDRADGLSSNSVQNFFQDREGDVWVATSDGLDVFRDLRIANFTVREGLTSGLTFSVATRKDGSVWAGNQGGLDFLPMGQTVFNSIRKNLPGRLIGATFEDHGGHLWVGVDQGIYIYDRGHFRAVLNPARALDKNRDVISFAEDANGDIWAELAGPNAVLMRIHDFQVREEIPKSTIPAGFSIVPDKQGGLWMCLLNGDLAHYQHGRWQIVSLAELTPPGFPRRSLFNIFVDSSGAVWGTGGGGLAEYRDGQLKFLTTKNGLSCNFTYSLISDSHGALWVYSQCGLTRIESSELQRFWDHPEAKVNVQHFDRLDGAQPGVTTFHPGAGRSSDGRLWFGNSVGLQMADPDHFAMNSELAPVHIEQLVADRRTYPALNQTILPALTRDIEIDYTALSFVMPQRVYFRHILEGYDTAWQGPGTRRQAFYSNLRPGHYRFRVIACNNDGVWNEQGASLDFTVAPAWYQTRAFVLFCILGGAVGAYLFYRLRMRQVARMLSARFDERLAERTRVARELHDTLLQTVQGSKMVADDAMENPSDADRMRHAMGQLSLWLGRAVDEGRAALNSLRASTTEKNNLAEAFRGAIEDCRGQYSMEALFSVAGQPQELHPMLRDEIYRIGYEAIINACAHSGGTRMEVTLSYANDLTVRVQDNGKGIDPLIAAKGREGHFGLQGMHERADRIGAKLTVTSSPGSGTKIVLVVPGRIVFRHTKAPVFARIKEIFSRAESVD
jgi:signal transduction histidine kinase/ligand-binding sensor domain-containing protein